MVLQNIDTTSCFYYASLLSNIILKMMSSMCSRQYHHCCMLYILLLSNFSISELNNKSNVSSIILGTSDDSYKNILNFSHLQRQQRWTKDYRNLPISFRRSDQYIKRDVQKNLYFIYYK